MVRKLMAKKNKGHSVGKLGISQASPISEANLTSEVGHIQQAPPSGNDSIPPFEELEPYMNEQIAMEYFNEVAPANINFANSYLGIDLTSTEYCGSSVNPDILAQGVMLDFCQNIESQGFCLDSVAMGLTSGIPLKTLTPSEIAECVLLSLGISVTIVGGAITIAEKTLAKAVFKKFLKTLVPGMGYITAVIAAAEFSLCCINNAD